MWVAVFWLNRLITFSSNRTSASAHGAELVRHEQIGARQRTACGPCRRGRSTSTGIVFVVFTTVLIGVPLPA